MTASMTFMTFMVKIWGPTFAVLPRRAAHGRARWGVPIDADARHRQRWRHAERDNARLVVAVVVDSQFHASHIASTLSGQRQRQVVVGQAAAERGIANAKRPHGKCGHAGAGAFG